MNRFSDYEPKSKVWIFPLNENLSDKTLSSNEKFQALSEKMKDFIASWTSHGFNLKADFEIVYQRFLVISVNNAAAGASGCSIDTLFRNVSTIVKSSGFELADSFDIFFKEGAEVKQMSRSNFKQYALEGKVSPKTLVFNNSIETIGEYLGGMWETEFAKSWHSRSFKVGAAV